ncbi:unnamed protein product [Miscanthus lutarioriparius]|uniref:Leucine-rich repeat-containing N-terminal plant-type domain-containing protein n=1 Tax=Miscanthus lutarioriparius TaxID=422564 RepID=A0A811PG01_9POAL|nr:unnamed protein product [Miscanthus lutarioriparius]
MVVAWAAASLRGAVAGLEWDWWGGRPAREHRWPGGGGLANRSHGSWSSRDAEVEDVEEGDRRKKAERILVAFEEQHPNDHVHIDIDTDVKINNPSLLVAHKALHALKQALYSGPNNFTGNWVGPDVCAYNGVSCVPSPHNESESAVASLDVNAADVAGYLPREIGLMSDLAVLHLNSIRHDGALRARRQQQLLRRALPCRGARRPQAQLPRHPVQRFRWPDPVGALPQALRCNLPQQQPLHLWYLETIGRTKATVIVLANNQLGGCIPRSIGEAAATLDQFIFINNSLIGCLSVETGLLTNVTVFDVSDNALTGSIPPTLAGLSKVEQLDLSRNMFTGDVPSHVCKLPALANLSVSYNFFTREASECSSTADASSFHDDANCMGQSRPMQKGADECTPVVTQPVDCTKVQQCGWPSPPPPPPPPRASPPPPPIIIPPVRGTKYQSPPPPLFPGY